MWFGLVVLALGILLLLQNLGILHADVWQVLWPVILILLGLSIVIKAGWKK
jgi:hypothetical protein